MPKLLVRALTLSLLLSTAFLSFAQTAPTITSINPPVGFSFGGTRVTIVGDGFAAGEIKTFCPVPPPGGTGLGTCPAQVTVGGLRAYVHSVTQTEIIATVLPLTLLHGQNYVGFADVRVIIEGRGEVTKTNGFYFDELGAGGTDNYTPVLLPLSTGEIRGANGSIWRTEFKVFNNTAHRLALVAPYSGSGAKGGEITSNLTPPILPTVGPLETGELFFHRPAPRQGNFVWIPNPLVGGTVMSLRVRDVSENAQGYGVEVPVVRKSDFATNIPLIDIPTNPRFRATLRIYHWSEAAGLQSRVTIIDQETKTEIKTVDLLSSGGPSNGTDFLRYPSYVEMDLLTPDVRNGAPQIRVEVDNVGALVSPPPPHIWAFVSITDNETQQVTLVTPRNLLP